MYFEGIEWPGNYKCAVMVTVNLNAQYFWLQVDQKVIDMPNTLSMGEFGVTTGLERVLSVLDNHNIKATFFVPGKVAETWADRVKQIAEKGHEIGCLGYSEEKYGLLDRSDQKRYMERAVNSIRENLKITPLGFRAPIMGELTKDTLAIAKELGMVYSSNLGDDDRPYWNKLEDGSDLLEIPIHYSLYDLPYFALNYYPAFPSGWCRIAGYEGVLSNWKDEFSAYYEYGLCYVLQIDPQTIGTPGRIALLEKILEFIRDSQNSRDPNRVWFAKGSEVVDYFNKIK